MFETKRKMFEVRGGTDTLEDGRTGVKTGRPMQVVLGRTQVEPLSEPSIGGPDRFFSVNCMDTANFEEALLIKFPDTDYDVLVYGAYPAGTPLEPVFIEGPGAVFVGAESSSTSACALLQEPSYGEGPDGTELRKAFVKPRFGMMGTIEEL